MTPKFFLAIIGLSLLIYNHSIACSYVSYSFCQTSHGSGNNVLCGKIIDTIPNGIRLQVIDLLRGNENRDTVIVWNGTDFDCNGNFSMAAVYMGAVGDTIVTVLPLIDSIEQPWQVIGDYRRPNYFGYTTEVALKNDTVRGFIAGYYLAPVEYRVTALDYATFRSKWPTQNEYCDLSIGINEAGESVSRSIFQFDGLNNELVFSISAPSTTVIKIYDLNGRLVLSTPFQTRITLSELSSGGYVVELTDGRASRRAKLLKW